MVGEKDFRWAATMATAGCNGFGQHLWLVAAISGP